MSSTARNRAPSIQSGMSSRGRSENVQDYAMTKNPITRYMEPCAATSSMFLYAQGNSVVCCLHDTLTIERRFSRHSDEVQLLAVDNHSDLGRGRLVVSYDAGQTAIVWDLTTGDEIARFASYEHLTCAAWMQNGNVAFGNSQGSVILFEPTTSEHLSARTLDQIAVTSLAPASDCRTFAIGYQNGSLLIATIQPRFTILYSLSTSRAPSPIVNMAWHASSSRGKAEMLAVQTHDGDLRVWSVAKSYSSDDPAKVVRILKRSENYMTGFNWMGWSKNGRIIQFSENQTLSWDVRTKHVTRDSIPTLDHVRGLAVYGPSATLFTLGANSTVQQFDLNAPAFMVVDVQHPANVLPPSPPVSLEEQQKGVASADNSESESIPIRMKAEVPSRQEDHMSPLARLVQEGVASQPETNQHRAPSDISSQSSLSMSSTSSRTPGHRYPQSVASRGMTENTYISSGSSMLSSATPHRDRRDRDSYSTSSLSSISMTSSQNRPRHQRPSRLRNEVIRSPEEAALQDLFKFTRSRLSDVPYKQPYMSDNSRLTNDDLRRQMLSTIFGWNGEVADLVRDEMSRHPVGSSSRILLSKWLGDIDTDSLMASSQNMTTVDWMVLAFNGMGEASEQIARACIHRLLRTGDVHTAATIMIGLGDHNDAIEIYDTHKYYMEALILTCLIFPAVWERQEAIIKRWGEWAVQHSQQQLAIRCMACTGKESSEPWTSPSAAQITFQSLNQSLNAAIPEVLSPPLSPPGLNRGPQRSVAKNASLKLITHFGGSNTKDKFFLGGPDDGQTPIAAAATPIAESALSPGGFGDPSTAVLRPSQRSAFNTPASARPSHGFDRKRLPSIGETPTDSHPREFLLPASKQHQDPHGVRQGHSQQGSIDEISSGVSGLNRASTASPGMMRSPHKKKDPPPPSPSPQSLAALMEGPPKRNGSRTRMPNGLDLQLPHLDPASSDITSPEQSEVSSTRHHWPSRRRGPGSVASSVTSGTSSVARSYRGHTGGKSLDDYIHSLDAAQNASRSRGRSRGRARESSRSRKGGSREGSHDRGRAASRTAFNPKAPKRSPTSPIPMSPEDLINLTTPKQDVSGEEAPGVLIDITHDELPPSTVKRVSKQVSRESSRPRASSRTASRDSRHHSPDRRPPALDLRGRGKAREGSLVRSPSSPLPLSANPMHFDGSDDEEDLRKALEAKERFRRKTGRSSSRSARDPASPGSVRDRPRERSVSRQRGVETKKRAVVSQQLTPAHAGDLKAMKDERQAKKEAAARELEERRKSLARRPSAPTIPHPDELFPTPPGNRSHAFFEHSSNAFVQPRDLPARSHTVEPGATRSMYANRGPQIGLPATPKAMRLVLESDPSKGSNVPVPPVPTTFAQASPPLSNQPSPERFSPKKTEPEVETQAPSLTLLPQTVYSPPSRHAIPRSMSAPPEEPIAPKSLQGGPSHRRVSHVQSMRKGSADSNIVPENTGRSARRPSHDDNIPPPPPPPPVLQELQHLALPPPPPPAPLPHNAMGKPVVYGGQTSGAIEVVMDDDQQQSAPQPPPVPVAIPVSEATVPIIAPPAPPSSRNGHSRGRSSVDNSIVGRISRATERMRSASRSRTNTPALNRTKSPEISQPAPYESVPHRNFKSPVDPYRTGLHQSEMI